MPKTKDSDGNSLSDFSYTKLSHLTESWDILRSVPEYEVETGKAIFEHLFTNCPDAKVLFGFSKEHSPGSQLILKSRRFLMHASYMVQMIDTSMTMMGPGTEILEEILSELGEKHAKFGVTKAMFQAMGHAIIHAVQTVSKTPFTDEVKEAWSEFFFAISKTMIKAGRAIARRKGSVGSVG